MVKAQVFIKLKNDIHGWCLMIHFPNFNGYRQLWRRCFKIRTMGTWFVKHALVKRKMSISRIENIRSFLTKNWVESNPIIFYKENATKIRVSNYTNSMSVNLLWCLIFRLVTLWSRDLSVSSKWFHIGVTKINGDKAFMFNSNSRWLSYYQTLFSAKSIRSLFRNL